MAAKYWYVAGNGSAAWSVATNWYNATGGTGGTAGVPTVVDDAIVDENSGSGTLTIAATATCNSLTTELFTGTLAGTSALTINTTDISINGGIAFYLGINSTYTGTITFNSSITAVTLTIFMSTFHKGGMTFNSPGGVSSWEGDLTITATLLLTAGSISGTNAYIGALSTSNANVRAFQYESLYLSGSGTLIAGTTQTNLNFYVLSIYLTNTTTSAKSLALSSNIYSTYVYLQGSGASTTTIASAASAGYAPEIYISKTGGGTIAFGTSTISKIEFIEGTDIAWLGTSTVTLLGDLTLCNSMSITTSNALVIGACYTLSCTITTFNKVFTSLLTINDPGGSSIFTIIGNYTSTYIGATSISIISGSGATFNGLVNVNTNISIGVNYFYNVSFLGLVTAANFTYTANAQAYLYLLNGANITGVFASLGFNLNFKGIFNLGSFTSSSTTISRYLNFNDSVINLTGTGTIWNTPISDAIYVQSSDLTINVIDSSINAITIAAEGLGYPKTLKLDRGASTGSCTFTCTSGNYVGFANFIDVGTSAHSIIVSSGGGIITGNFVVNGNPSNLITLNSSSGTSTFNLAKSPNGLVNCDYLNIQHCIATPSNTWYAGTNSINNQAIATAGSGWIFSNIPPRKLSSGGVG